MAQNIIYWTVKGDLENPNDDIILCMRDSAKEGYHQLDLNAILPYYDWPWHYANPDLITQVYIETNLDITTMDSFFINFTNLVDFIVEDGCAIENVVDMSSCFEGCINFNHSIIIPNSVTDMENCFEGCVKFNQPIIIPNSVTNMDSCFYHCQSFDQPILIPRYVGTAVRCFVGCTSLKQVYILGYLGNMDEGQPGYYRMFYNTTQSIVLIPGTRSFNNYNRLQTIANQYSNVSVSPWFCTDGEFIYEKIDTNEGGIEVLNKTKETYNSVPSAYEAPDESITRTITVMDHCFAECINLNQSITIPNSIINMESCFSGCESLNGTITIPNSVINMCDCFANCINFNQPIILSNNVTDLSYCFQGCQSFNQSIVIPNSVINMTACFYDCSSFNQSIIIPNNVTSILSCFAWCISFNNGGQSITIPNSVTDMRNCFQGCTDLNNIIQINSNLSSYSNIFHITTKQIIVYGSSPQLKTIADSYSNVYMWFLNVTITKAQRNESNVTDIDLEVSINHFLGNGASIGINVYKNNDTTPISNLIWDPTSLIMDSTIKTFSTTIHNIDELTSLNLRIVATENPYGSSAPRIINIPTNYYTIDFLKGGKEISFGEKASENDLFKELIIEPSDWSTNWTDYYEEVNNEYIPISDSSAPIFSSNTYYKKIDSLFKCRMETSFNDMTAEELMIFINSLNI